MTYRRKKARQDQMIYSAIMFLVVFMVAVGILDFSYSNGLLHY